jgi:hypothetical protein
VIALLLKRCFRSGGGPIVGRSLGSKRAVIRLRPQAAWRELYPPIYNAVDARDAAEHEAAKKQRAERAAATRTANAKRKAERIAAKDRRIAELEAQLASKPKLTLVK